MLKFKHSENELISAEISWDGRHVVTGFYNGMVKVVSFKTNQVTPGRSGETDISDKKK